jgi:hypothetical protein
MQNCTDGMSDDAVKTMSRTSKKVIHHIFKKIK